MEGKSDNDQALAPPMRVQETASGIAETDMEAVATRTILKLVVAELSKISIGWYACYEIFAVFPSKSLRPDFKGELSQQDDRHFPLVVSVSGAAGKLNFSSIN